MQYSSIETRLNFLHEELKADQEIKELFKVCS